MKRNQKRNEIKIFCYQIVVSLNAFRFRCDTLSIYVTLNRFQFNANSLLNQCFYTNSDHN